MVERELEIGGLGATSDLKLGTREGRFRQSVAEE